MLSTALVWIEVRCRREKQRLAKLARVSRDLVWAFDRDGRWSFLGDAAADIYGMSPAGMIGRPFTEFAASDHAAEDRAFVSRAVATRESVHYETVHETARGDRVRLAFVAIAHDGGALGTATDVTHLRDLESRLVRTERMHAVGALAGGVAHDFKNLLTVVSGQAEIAKRGAPAAVGRRLDMILETAERGRGLVDDLLVFARNQDQRHEVVDMAEIVRGMIELVHRLLGDEILLETAIKPRPAYVRADRNKIEQIVMNLVVNARDASQPGSKVSIKVTSGRLSGKKVEELRIEPGRWAILQVTDRGSGMEQEVIEQAFDPFYTTKEIGKGTGLGLATVKGIVEQYGGAISTRSAPGRGTRMSVLLPLVPSGQYESDETADELDDFPEGG